MEQNKGDEALTLDSYIRAVTDQEIKGILLKLKNEIRRDDADQGVVESLISSIRTKNEDTASAVLKLIEKEG